VSSPSLRSGSKPCKSSSRWTLSTRADRAAAYAGCLHIRFAPDNMVYDKSARTYVRGSDFKAQFLEPDASRYLAQLRSLADGILDREDSWIANLPPYASAPTPVRGVSPVTLRSVVGAIR